jgi:transposase-like protein
VWPQAVTQTCVVHLLRNSFRYAGRQHWDAIAKRLRPVYTAPTEAAAMERFIEFTEAWGQRYPAIVRLWEQAWAACAPSRCRPDPVHVPLSTAELRFDRAVRAARRAFETGPSRMNPSARHRGGHPSRYPWSLVAGSEQGSVIS